MNVKVLSLIPEFYNRCTNRGAAMLIMQKCFNFLPKKQLL